MQSKYEAPELTLIGQADEVVMGFNAIGNDLLAYSAADFEFEQD